jgi:alpha-D-ribose 1-methylphosphonate 5-triphosphate synthase subunit PhnH
MIEGLQDMNGKTAFDQPLTGFDSPVHDSQRVFRGVMEAMSHPGKIVILSDLPDAPLPLNRASAAICLSLVDFETPLWADAAIAASSQAMNHLKFHCGCPVTSAPKEARTALVSDANSLISFDRFHIGSDERPDLSTTVIVQVAGLSDDGGVRLTGPGIKTVSRMNVEGIEASFWEALKANAQLFPRGVDLILTSDDAIACLPRTTQVEV